MGWWFLMNVLILFLLTFFYSTTLAIAAEESLENNFNIKAGLAVSRVNLKSGLLQSQEEDATETNGYGFNTSAGYKWNNWELLVASDALFGKLHELSFQVDSTVIRGTGSFRIFSVSPMIRYYTPYTIYNRWNFFVSAGPSWSLHTFILNNTLNGSQFSDKKRISFENRGGGLNVGFEEIVPYKEVHPTFIEFGYSYMRSKRIFIVDATDFKDVKTLSEGNSKGFYGHYLVARFGITLF